MTHKLSSSMHFAGSMQQLAIAYGKKMILVLGVICEFAQFINCAAPFVD